MIVKSEVQDRGFTPPIEGVEQYKHWQRNLVVIWMAQFFSSMAFAFAIPFAPYFLQELGVTDRDKLHFWVALFSASAALTVAVCSPIWGAISDRVGRRPMLLRAYLGAAVILTLMGTVTRPAVLIGLRLAQGILSGTISASQSLMAASVPRERSGLALGGLSSAVFSGGLAGCFLGGWTSAIAGYRTSFFMAGGVSLLSALFVVFGVREHFVPSRREKSFMADLLPPQGQLQSVFPILTLMATVMFVVQFDASYIPLFVQEIHGSLEGASFWTGTLFACSATAGAISGLVVGWLTDRISAPTVGRWSAVIAGILMVPLAFIRSMAGLMMLRFGITFASGGLDPAFQIWLSKITPSRYRGMVFGWSATARYLGMTLAPLAGGLAATAVGLRGLFICGAVLYLMLAVVLARSVKRIPLTSGGEEAA